MSDLGHINQARSSTPSPEAVASNMHTVIDSVIINGVTYIKAPEAPTANNEFRQNPDSVSDYSARDIADDMTTTLRRHLRAFQRNNGLGFDDIGLGGKDESEQDLLNAIESDNNEKLRLGEKLGDLSNEADVELGGFQGQQPIKVLVHYGWVHTQFYVDADIFLAKFANSRDFEQLCDKSGDTVIHLHDRPAVFEVAIRYLYGCRLTEAVGIVVEREDLDKIELISAVLNFAKKHGLSRLPNDIFNFLDAECAALNSSMALHQFIEGVAHSYPDADDEFKAWFRNSIITLPQSGKLWVADIKQILRDFLQVQPLMANQIAEAALDLMLSTTSPSSADDINRLSAQNGCNAPIKTHSTTFSNVDNDRTTEDYVDEQPPFLDLHDDPEPEIRLSTTTQTVCPEGSASNYHSNDCSIDDRDVEDAENEVIDNLQAMQIKTENDIWNTAGGDWHNAAASLCSSPVLATDVQKISADVTGTIGVHTSTAHEGFVAVAIEDAPSGHHLAFKAGDIITHIHRLPITYGVPGDIHLTGMWKQNQGNFLGRWVQILNRTVLPTTIQTEIVQNSW